GPPFGLQGIERSATGGDLGALLVGIGLAPCMGSTGVAHDPGVAHNRRLERGSFTRIARSGRFDFGKERTGLCPVNFCALAARQWAGAQLEPGKGIALLRRWLG